MKYKSDSYGKDTLTVVEHKKCVEANGVELRFVFDGYKWPISFFLKTSDVERLVTEIKSKNRRE